MKQSLVLSWKFLTSKLHQPLPLNRRESQQLLTLLHDSFNRNLDHHYPPGLAESEQSPNQHIQSLLQSPLFDNNRAPRSPPSARGSEANGNTPHVRDLILAVEQPVECFKQRVAAGKATTESAKLALGYQMKKILASALPDRKEAMKDSRIGSLVVNWLWSSGQHERLDFIQDRNFTAHLMPFLVAEKHYKPVWDWLQRSSTTLRRPRRKEAWHSLQQGIEFMFRALIQSEVAYGAGLQSAIQMFLTNHKSMTQSSQIPHVTANRIHSSAGAYLMWAFASHGASADVDDATINNLDLSVDYWARNHMVAPYKALIGLSHPRRPDTSRALQWVSSLEASDGLIGERNRSSNVRIGLRTVEVLLAQGSSKEAARVMKVLQTRFAPEVGSDEQAPDPEEGEERSILRSLNLLLAT